LEGATLGMREGIDVVIQMDGAKNER